MPLSSSRCNRNIRPKTEFSRSEISRRQCDSFAKLRSTSSMFRFGQRLRSWDFTCGLQTSSTLFESFASSNVSASSIKWQKMSICLKCEKQRYWKTRLLLPKRDLSKLPSPLTLQPFSQNTVDTVRVIFSKYQFSVLENIQITYLIRDKTLKILHAHVPWISSSYSAVPSSTQSTLFSFAYDSWKENKYRR